jgi:hypothetical protein
MPARSLHLKQMLRQLQSITLQSILWHTILSQQNHPSRAADDPSAGPTRKAESESMKCFYHAEKDAVGTCSQCGKAACRDCIQDVGGALLCKGCMVLKLQAHAERKEAKAAVIQLTREAAGRKIRTSKILFVVIAALAFLIGIAQAFASLTDPKAPPFLAFFAMVPVGSLFAGYLIWSCYWGIPAIWRRWWGMFRRVGCFLIANPLTWLILIVVLFEIPLFVGYMYGVFGGAIYEYRKCRRIAEGAV